MTLAEWGLITGQLLVATACGGVIGYQRETLERPAGFRTHVLVCVGSAIYMLVSRYLAGDMYDPGRIAAQVASGIGFLGAGTIIKQGSIVRGLTTAASLWAVAGIGLAAGTGRDGLPIAVLGTVVVFISLGFFTRIEDLISRSHSCRIYLTVASPREQMDWIRGVMTEHGMQIQGLAISDAGDNLGFFTIDARTGSHEDVERTAGALAQGQAVRDVRWECR